MKAIVIAAIITGFSIGSVFAHAPEGQQDADVLHAGTGTCLLYTSPSPRDRG